MSRPSSALKLCYKDETRTFDQHMLQKSHAENHEFHHSFIRFFGVANVFLSARDVEMFVNVLGGFWEGNAYLTSTLCIRVYQN